MSQNQNEDNVIEVDFTGADKPDVLIHKDTAQSNTEATARAFVIKEAGIIGLEFDRPVDVFRMDMHNADLLTGALVACLMALKEGGKDGD